jgi:phosphoglycolate phosphatase
LNSLRLILFDIDGTLVQTGGAGQQAFARVFASRWGIPSATDGVHFAGRSDRAIVREAFLRNRLDPSPANFQGFFDDYVFWLDHLLGRLSGRVLRGAHELIRRFQQQPNPPVIGLITGNIRLGAQIKLTHYNLWDHFRTGGFGDDHEDRADIAAAAVDRGARLVGSPLRGEEVLIIGDTPQDIACAQAVGAHVLAVATGQYSVDQLRPLGPTWVCEDLSQSHFMAT